MPVPLPDSASPGDAGHINDHNMIVDAIIELRNSSGGGSPNALVRADIVAGTNITTTPSTGNSVIIATPNTLIRSDIIAGTNITATPGSNNTVTIATPSTLVRSDIVAGTNITAVAGAGNSVTINATSDPNKMSASNVIAGANITLDKTGQNVTINSTGGGGGGGVSDHGALTGLTDDDHSQYHNNTRGDARYSLLAHTHSGVYATTSHTHSTQGSPVVLSVIQSGASYPARPGGATQTHIYIGSADPTASGFVVGYDIWVDTSG